MHAVMQPTQDGIIMHIYVDRLEMDILQRTDLPYVVQYHRFSEKTIRRRSNSMEHMDMGMLETLLKKNENFNKAELVMMLRQVLNRLSYLHVHKIMHHDIKSSNLLGQ